jgi:hypothetical protein
MRSGAYEVLQEITPENKALIDEGLFLRGRIVSSYSQVEFLLADFSVKLDLRFPYLIRDRLKAVKQIADRKGYEGYKADLDRLCDELVRYDEIRTFMAHGFLTVTVDRLGNHQFEFRRYRRDGDGKFTLLSAKTTMPRLREAADHITQYVEEVLQLFRRIYHEKKLES